MAKKLIRPIGARVLIEPLPEDQQNKHVSGIILAAGSTPINYLEGKILAVGSLVTLIKKGEDVLFLKYGYDEVQIEGKKFFLADENIIIGAYEAEV